MKRAGYRGIGGHDQQDLKGDRRAVNRSGLSRMLVGFGRVGLLVGVVTGIILGLVFGFLLFQGTMKKVVKIEPEASSDLLEEGMTFSGSGETMTREELAEKFERVIDENQPRYRSSCLFEVEPREELHERRDSNSVTRRFVNSQLQALLAPKTLELAMAKIQLEQRWGKGRQEVMNILRKIVSAKHLRGTDLIEISVEHYDKQSALVVCEAVYLAFAERRRNLELSLRNELLKAIQRELQNKSDRVAELRKRLMHIAEKSGLIYRGTEQGDESIRVNNGLLPMVEKELYQAEREKEHLDFKFARLIPLDRDELVAVVADLEDEDFQNTYQKYVAAKRGLQVALAKAGKQDHLDVAERKASIAELEQVLEQQAVRYRESLQHQLRLLESRVKKMREFLSSDKQAGTERARYIQEFNIARKEYRTALAIREVLAERYDVEKAKLVMPLGGVILHQAPEVQKVELK